MDYTELFNQFKEVSIQNRYVALHHIEPLLLRLKERGKVAVLGNSVQGKPIYVYKNGFGKHKIMMWSQMHGNESTTTKAVLDLFNYLDSEQGYELQEKFTFCIIPMLNPDGAEAWTRNNANDVDLNRDSQSLTQPESQLLRKCLNEFAPDFCFNLHDQRTIFGVSETLKSATVSFLAPSYNLEKEVNSTRKKAMEVIGFMNEVLQKYIPGQVGRFDDEFNINCIGDTVQNSGIPTVLIEAGHYQNDYQREQTRKYVFISLLAGLKNLNFFYDSDVKILDYFNIPANSKLFFDIICKKIKIYYDNTYFITNFAVQFSEKLIAQEIIFEAYIKEIGDLKGFEAHQVFDFNEKLFFDGVKNYPEKDQKADFFVDNIKIVNGMPFLR